MATLFKSISIIVLSFLIFPNEIFAQEVPDQNRIDEINRLGQLIFDYDQAAWHGTDAVMPLLQNAENLQDRISGYVVERVEDSWVVAFGKLTDDKSEIIIAYQAVLTDDYQVIEALEHEDGVRQSGFLRDAMYTKSLVMEDFEPADSRVTYNTCIIPADNGEIYVYVLPAQPAHRVYYLGGDFRYTVDPEKGTITDKKQLHNRIIPMDLRNDPPGITVATVVTDVYPPETVVFYAVSRPPTPDSDILHYSLTDNWVFTFNKTGISGHMSVEDFRSKMQPDNDQ